MQKLAEICVRRPVFATMLILALVVLGLNSYRKLGVDLLPKIEFPTVTITTTLRGASPEEVESQVTRRIEEAVNTVSGIDELRSLSAEGVSIVYVTFVWRRTRTWRRRRFATASPAWSASCRATPIRRSSRRSPPTPRRSSRSRSRRPVSCARSPSWWTTD